jgi:hypothetical protein
MIIGAENYPDTPPAKGISWFAGTMPSFTVQVSNPFEKK